jgi:hypothetical protein
VIVVGSEAVVWAKTPDDEGAEVEAQEDSAEIDESFAVRRLRRWLSGMFGGETTPKEKPPDSEPES